MGPVSGVGLGPPECCRLGVKSWPEFLGLCRVGIQERRDSEVPAGEIASWPALSLPGHWARLVFALGPSKSLQVFGDWAYQDGKH